MKNRRRAAFGVRDTDHNEMAQPQGEAAPFEWRRVVAGAILAAAIAAIVYALT